MAGENIQEKTTVVEVSDIAKIEEAFSKLERARKLWMELECRAGDILSNDFIEFEDKLKYLRELKSMYECEYLKIRYELDFKHVVILRIIVELTVNDKVYKYTTSYVVLKDFRS